MQKSDQYTRSFLPANTQLKVDEDELNLPQILAALRRRVLLIAGIAAATGAAAVWKTKSEPPVYQGSFEILTKPVTGESKVIANIPQTINSQDGVSSPELAKEIDTTITVLQSPRILDPIVEKLKSNYSDITYEEIHQNLKIEVSQKNILQVAYTHPNEKRVKAVLTSLADAYLNYSLAEIQSDVDQAISFVNQQRQPLEQRVQFWQNKLRDLRVDNNLIEPTQKAEDLAGQIADLQKQRTDNRVLLGQMLSQYEDLRQQLEQKSNDVVGSVVLRENKRYQQVLDQIQAVEIEIQLQSAILTDENPKMMTLKQKKENLLPLLAKEAARVKKEYESQIRELAARDKFLEQNINGLNQEVKKLANVSLQYNNFQRELQIATDALNQFSTKQQALQIEKAQKQQPWQLLDPKLSLVNKPEAATGSASKNLVVGSLIGLVLGMGAALLIDKLSNIFYTSQELKDSTRLPLLGIVPLRKELVLTKSEKRLGVLPALNHPSFFEVFRSLYTNILLLGSDTAIRSLVISSPGQGDGKSTVAIQLALAAAAMGQRVLLVDANLRAPSLHRRVGLMNIQGLTDVISQDLDWNNVIERSPQEENLFVMTAGPTPPDPVRLLASRKMQDLMTNLQETYDLVIYDTPPMLGFADAYLLAANTNGIVMVAGLGKLKRTELYQTLEEIQLSGTPMLGMIANKSKEAMPASYNYYQQYYKRAELIGESAAINDNSHVSLLTSSWRKITGK
jgi:capsular exopolysaccharide synthesis family protein